MAHFEVSVALSCSLEEAFDFFLRPENILRISPPEMGLSFVKAPEVMELGSMLEFKVLSHGHVQQITHEITVLERPWQIVERQVQGPFKRWLHAHLFAEQDDGRVTMTDRIDFGPPKGVIGLLINEEKILDALDEGFAHRHEHLRRLLSDGA